ncbi:MAG TPA: FAD-dependent thymidylate synthase [Candidatus Paceibacterota bacterium]|nr:FAD-dependent thymidylate synthase [Candidatus Paceibacterota bacterium]
MDDHQTEAQQKIEALRHVRKPLPGNGQVVVLDTGAIINAEEEAMLQALHSRSLGGIDAHLLKLAKKGAADFMDLYYVKYGDKSIGDGGTTTIFIEGVSMLVAKAIQDSQLYNGQESSTRYINFETQPFADPHDSAEGKALLESLRAFHLKGVAIMKEELARQHPWDPTIQWGLSAEDNTEKVWQKAINARAFDIMRAFLPAGAATNLAWHTELRHANDHLLRLRHHPLEEVRVVAEAIGEALAAKYPHSSFSKRYPASEEYVSEWMRRMYYFNEKPGSRGSNTKRGGVCLDRSTIEPAMLKAYGDLLALRPFKTELPKFMAECGTMQFSFLLDYGSYRDLQRQRSIIQRMPLLTDKHGFEEWYLAQLPEGLRKEAVLFLARYSNGLGKLGLSPLLEQYYVPMGYRVTCRATGDLPALAFVVELRSGITVHPTLRVVAQDIGGLMLEQLEGTGFKLHLDTSPDAFNMKRGTQDIVEKAPSLQVH